MFYYYDETDGIVDMIDDVYLFENKNDKREKEILDMANGVFHRYDKTMRELAKI